MGLCVRPISGNSADRGNEHAGIHHKARRMATVSCGWSLSVFGRNAYEESGVTMTEEQLNDKFDRYGALWLLCTLWNNGPGWRSDRILSRLSRKGYSPSDELQAGHFETDKQRYYFRRWLRPTQARG